MSLRQVLFATIGLLLASASPAYAYVDPGSGGMIVQLLLGGTAGVVVLAKLFWHRLARFFGVKPREDDEAR